MRRTMQLLAVTCAALFIVSAATPADAKKKWWHSGEPSGEWASGRVSFTGSCVPPAFILGTLPGKFRLTDVVVANPSSMATVMIGEAAPPPDPLPDPLPPPTLGVTRLTLVVPGGTTFTDTFRVALVLAAGDLVVSCDQNVYITLSGFQHGAHSDEHDDGD